MRLINTLCLISLFCFAGCGGANTNDDGGSDLGTDPEIWFITPTAGDIIGSNATIEVGLEGDFERVELLADGVVLADYEIVDANEPVILDWDTTAELEGGIDLCLRGTLTSGDEVTCDPIATVIDHTKPAVVFAPEINWLDIHEWMVTVSLDVQDTHLDNLLIKDELQNVLLDTDTPPASFTWTLDGSVASGMHVLTLEANDLAGNQTLAQTDGFILAVPNDLPAIEFDRTPFVYDVPADWATVETHIKGWAEARDNITAVLAWIRWEADTKWELEFAVGQGICPHRGIAYTRVEGDDGEIFVNLRRENIPAGTEAAFPLENQGTDVFPDNNDPLTFGSFFGHIGVLDQADHVGEQLPIEMHMVFINAD